MEIDERRLKEYLVEKLNLPDGKIPSRIPFQFPLILSPPELQFFICSKFFTNMKSVVGKNVVPVVTTH